PGDLLGLGNAADRHATRRRPELLPTAVGARRAGRRGRLRGAASRGHRPAARGGHPARRALPRSLGGHALRRPGVQRQRRGRRARQPADHEGAMTTSVETRGDPITTEIIRNAFVSCAQDMNATLIRSSYTPIIYEGKDCSVAILDDRGDVLGQSLGLPLFLGNLEICVKLAAELFGWEAFRPGDVFYMNDSYMTGTHLNDATIFGPIYWQDRLVGFSATRAHWLDVGGKDA